MSDLSRLQKLEILADIWFKVYAFHPALVMEPPRMDWHGLLLENLEAVEQAKTTEALARVLNRGLLEHLRDPLTFAYPVDSPPALKTSAAPGWARLHEGWNEDGRRYIYRQRWVESSAGPHQSSYFDTLGLSLNSVTTWEQPAMHFPSFGQDCASELSQGQRLLGLFKVHGVLRGFSPFFDAELIQLAAWIPQAEAAPTLDEYRRVLLDFAAPLKDGHVQVVYPDGPEETEEPASRHYALKLPEAVKHIRRLTDGTGYMTPFTMPDSRTLDEAFRLLQDSKSLIIDLRGYPRCHFKQAFIRHLCNYPVKSPHYRIPVVSDPDLRQRSWKHIQNTVEPDAEKYCYSGPVIALTDETVQSAAEDFAMYLRSARRATLVGRTTAGCQGNAAFIELPGGGWMSFSGMRVTHPGGEAVQGIGIMPDIEVPQTEQARIENKDGILQAGIEFLQS